MSIIIEACILWVCLSPKFLHVHLSFSFSPTSVFSCLSLSAFYLLPLSLVLSLSRAPWLIWFLPQNNLKQSWDPTAPQPPPQPLASILQKFTFLAHQFLNPILERHRLRVSFQKQNLKNGFLEALGWNLSKYGAIILHRPTKLLWGLINAALASNRPVSLAGPKLGSAIFLLCPFLMCPFSVPFHQDSGGYRVRPWSYILVCVVDHSHEVFGYFLRG